MIRFFIFSLLISSIFNGLSAQHKALPGWYFSGKKDSMGIDLEGAYKILPKDRKPVPVIVAVIDGGTQTDHPDLQAHIWHNTGEIPFNGVDDDHNGYVDDTVGWNFIGNPNGEMVQFDNLEKTRTLKFLMDQLEGLSAEQIDKDPSKKAVQERIRVLQEELDKEKEGDETELKILEMFIRFMDDVKEKTGNSNPGLKELQNFPMGGSMDYLIRQQIIMMMDHGDDFSSVYSQMTDSKKQYEARVKYSYNIYYDTRKIVGDHYNNSGEKYYGNNNVCGPEAMHGTHVAGIIAAVRHNGIGMDGIAENVKIMAVRVVPQGDERDKDVANGIRYAVDNGARIINMSFGKEFVWNKAVVDSAVAYAVSKGVLLVHAAGNDHKDIDVEPNYPNDSLPGNSFAKSWIEIGASAPSSKSPAASFSNFGKHNVDVFAPGESIYSTINDSEYDYSDGTSMAAPVVTGLAALILSYYPTLTAPDLKEILMKSAKPIRKKVSKPGGGKIRFKKLCVTGGIVNAAKAVRLAGTYHP